LTTPLPVDSEDVTAVVRAAATCTWWLPPGPRNSISDVPGVRVGHATLYEPECGVCTGITLVVPSDDVVLHPLTAAVHVINGYGKSVGLMQINELGELESPIAITGVFSVPSVHAAVQAWLMRADPAIGAEGSARSVNSIVLECNDAHMNDPRAGTIGEDELAAAFADAEINEKRFGTIGAGVGMTTFGCSGAVGTASRRMPTEDGEATLGVLVLTNFGQLEDLVVAGVPVGRRLGSQTSIESIDQSRETDGSVIVIVAIDVPLAQAQLERLAKRAQNALARTGCITAGTSGEVVLAFSTSREQPGRPVRWQRQLDIAFRAVGEAVEEAVLAGLLSASDVTGRGGRRQAAFPTEQLQELLNLRVAADAG
jgi:D-aminopeptidase